jgi:predicted type IV restriction endonuclease
MSETFEELLSRLTKDYSLFQNIEEAVRQAVVLPILNQLGWNPYNLREVSPEFKVGNGRVDYCLKQGEKKFVFIEVKRLVEDLEKHEKQLLEYSFTDGVEIAVLTNGLLWWFYLPLGKGSWQQRRFFTIDIKQQEAYTAAQHFIEFLGYDSISNGDALKKAKSLQASREKTQLVNQTVPKAWAQLISEPDEILLELLAEKVESMCGHRPELQTLSEFIQDDGYEQRAQEKKLSRVKVQKTEQKTIDTVSMSKRSSRKRGIIVTISGKDFKAKTVADLYSQVLEYLYKNGFLEKLKSYIPYATSRQRFLISTEPVHPKGNQFVIPVEYKGYYMETHKSYSNAIKSLSDFLGLIGMSIHDKT